MTLDVSFNEVETLVIKAARGAGLSWGLAEETGRAARWLAGFRLPWSETLLPLLADWNEPQVATAVVEGGIRLSAADGGVLSPLLCGPHLADRAVDIVAGSMMLRRVAMPLWLLPWAAQTASIVGRPMELRCGVASAVVDRRHCALAEGSDHALVGPPLDVRCGASSTDGRDGRGLPATDRALVEVARWEAFEALAARTYVPASSLSRAVGAGAGETDND